MPHPEKPLPLNQTICPTCGLRVVKARLRDDHPNTHHDSPECKVLAFQKAMQNVGFAQVDLTHRAWIDALSIPTSRGPYSVIDEPQAAEKGQVQTFKKIVVEGVYAPSWAVDAYSTMNDLHPELRKILLAVLSRTRGEVRGEHPRLVAFRTVHKLSADAPAACRSLLNSWCNELGIDWIATLVRIKNATDAVGASVSLTSLQGARLNGKKPR